MFVLNEFSLFFHNHRVETPPAKKNITNRVEEWVQGVPPLPKTLRTSAPTLVTSKVSSTLTKKSNTKSVSCAVVSASTSQVFQKPAHQVKCQAKEAEPESDDDEYVPPPGSFGGLDEDKDDTVEWVAAASSPIRASTATQSSKVSIYMFSRWCVIATWSVEPPQHLYWDRISFSRKKITQETRQQRTSWGCNQVRGGLAFSSWLIFDILAAQTTRISGPSNHMTLFACFKKFTMEMSTLAGEKSSAWLIPALLFIMWYDNLP